MKTKVNILLFSVLMAFLGVFIFEGCSTTKYLPIEQIEHNKTEIRDSIVYKDSIVYVPQERIVEIVPQLDTLRMEIDLAEAEAYLDTSIMMLRGELKSKKTPEIRYIDRIEYREKVDTVYIKEPAPYPVEVYKTPKWAYYTLIFSILVIGFVILKIYLKLRLP